MLKPAHPSRRHFLATASVALAGCRTNGTTVPSGESEAWVARSQALPEPRIVLPTDALPPPTGPKKRIAAVTTAYFKYSHADDIITKFIEGYAIVSRTHLPHCQVVGMYIEQFPESDIGRGMAKRYGIPLFDTVAGAVTVGGDKLAVDGVLLIGEHGDYPFNEKGQHLYPRRKLFADIVSVFRRSGKAVPVYNDKHHSYSWEDAEWMHTQSRELGFPMMGGSSVPVTWRKPPLAFKPGIRLDDALAVGYGGVEVYGFHTFELLQCFVEHRRGGEVGVKAVQCLEGDAAWNAADAGRWDPRLVKAALRHVPSELVKGTPPRDLRKLDPKAVVFLVEYSDGFVGTAYLSRGLVNEFAFAASVTGHREPVATWCPLLKPQRDHFSLLCNHIEVMFRTGKPSYPVERTYLVTGALAALVDSHYTGGKRIETPHLAKVGYTPAPEATF